MVRRSDRTFGEDERIMLGHLGFSYIGLIFLLMLFVPNLIWTKATPEGYSSESENRLLLIFERCGEVLTSCCALLFTDFNVHSWSNWTWWLIAAFVLMLIYEIWWMRYFFSKRTLKDFYSDIIGIPLAGATLPVISFFRLGIYGKFIFMIIADIILGIGHIGIHIQHLKEIKRGDIE